MDAATGNEVRRNRTTQTVKTVVHSDYMLKRLLCGYTTTEQVSKLSLRNSKLLRKKNCQKNLRGERWGYFFAKPCTCTRITVRHISAKPLHQSAAADHSADPVPLVARITLRQRQGPGLVKERSQLPDLLSGTVSLPPTSTVLNVA